ncbi:MAG: hypothetical protein J6X57_02955 [Bacteroidales bacterium]|nr:hypothetical protein [Bacteroidales bacterium]
MKKLMIAGLIILQACSSSNYVEERFAETTPEGISTAVAHRGCWLRENDGEYYIPENSTYGIEMAARYGYPSIELDVKYTLDNVMVVMHDGTINRTMRNAADYSRIEKPVRVSDMMFEDLRQDYVLESSDPAQRTPIPTLKEMLLACKKTGVIPMLHSKVLESYELAQKILGDKWIAFDANYPSMKYARSVSDCLVLWDPDRLPAEETVALLKEIGGWCGMSTMKYDMQDAAYIAAMQAGGCVTQSSIFPTPHEQRALQDGTDIELSDFYWFQTNSREPVSTVCEEVELKAGETWQSPAVEVGDFAALTLEISFAGALELQVDDHRDLGKNGGWQYAPRVYGFEHPAPAAEKLGLRLYKTAPSFRIVAEEDIVVKINTCVYEI